MCTILGFYPIDILALFLAVQLMGIVAGMMCLLVLMEKKEK